MAKRICSLGDGSLGNVTITSNQTINTYAKVSEIGNKYVTISSKSKASSYSDLLVGSDVLFHVSCTKAGKTEISKYGIGVFTEIVSVDDNKISLKDDIPNVDLSNYYCQLISIPKFNNLTVEQSSVITYPFSNFYGGVIVARARNTIDLSNAGMLNVEKTGIPKYVNYGNSSSLSLTNYKATGINRENELYSNDKEYMRFLMSEGNGIVIVICDNLKLSDTARMGATWSGSLGCGAGGTNPSGEHPHWTMGEDASSTTQTGGRGGDLDGAYGAKGGNSGYSGYAGSTSGTLVHEGLGGASLFLFTHKITDFSLSAISTGGGGGKNSTNITKEHHGGNGGAGYGGGGSATGSVSWGCGGGGGGYCEIYLRETSSITEPSFKYAYSKYYIQNILSILGLVIARQPLNFLDKSRVTGFNIAGIEPANTSRHVAFKVDDVWNKLTVSSGTAELTALETQEITADSLIAEGNTVAELQSVTDCTPFVGKLVYPAVALYADSSAEVMPTFGMTVNALIDTTVNVYSFTDYSQEYAISDGDDVSIIGLVAETELKGNGKVDITARIKSNGEWSEYMSLNAVQMKQASAIQLKAVYTVQNTDGSDSAKITSVVIKYNTAGAVTSNATTEIVTVTQKFTNDLTYVHAYCKHKELVDAKINAYCSIRKHPQKRVQYQVGNGTGALKTYTLPDSGVNQDTLAVYVDGKFISDFGYNTETSEITLTADKDAVVSATYEYGWEMSDWLPMEQGASQINDSGNYTTEYTYTIPSHDGIFTVTSVKFELARPEGHVDNETIGTGTGRRQMIRLPHIARKETIVCNGKWSYDYDNQRLTIIAPENEPIVISYDWIAESPKVYSIAAGWAD